MFYIALCTYIVDVYL